MTPTRNRFDRLAARALVQASAPARVLAPCLALALGIGGLVAPPARAGTMTVPLNHSARLALAGPAASVVVGNPAVADVTVVDSRTVFVSGRGPGSTDVSVLDPLGRVLFSGDIRVSNQAGAHVTVHRGTGTVADMACDPTCVAVATPTSGAKPGTMAAGALMGATVPPLAGATAEAVSNAAPVVSGATTTSLLGHT